MSEQLSIGATSGSRAVFSPCRTYRYTLHREWGDPEHRCLFVMLNPSTADETQDDPTIRRCIGYARTWGYGALDVGNIFALRSTDPQALYKHTEPVGADNDSWLSYLATRAAIVVCAWGSHGRHRGRGINVHAKLQRAGVTPHALKLTSTGQPCHPLYLPAALKPFPLEA